MQEGKLFTVSVALIVLVVGVLPGSDATVISGVVPLSKNHFQLTSTGGFWKLGLP